MTGPTRGIILLADQLRRRGIIPPGGRLAQLFHSFIAVLALRCRSILLRRLICTIVLGIICIIRPFCLSIFCRFRLFSSLHSDCSPDLDHKLIIAQIPHIFAVVVFGNGFAIGVPKLFHPEKFDGFLTAGIGLAVSIRRLFKMHTHIISSIKGAYI